MPALVALLGGEAQRSRAAAQRERAMLRMCGPFQVFEAAVVHRGLTDRVVARLREV